MSALKPKHQRLVLLAIALVAIIGAGLLASYALRNEASYFYTADQIAANPPKPGELIRLGGMVQEGSLSTLEDGVTVAFTVTDMKSATVPVRYTGILPDLFVEGSGVVADGRMDEGGTFIAEQLLAKHDENYVPRELQDMQQHSADETLKTLETSQ
ncbi:cytochrome c maturation protein CcmE [Pontixanthobacter aquaemixtae]|uniref:Cytochrome c-type biogenesis protein CcmE n=1 Tax=Pontixanthobacter aquaemixtae TaxID=1958940 RepID=A0A844ZQN7_9SPHN|nr:cytochrome c maturation protein CcmE [Pontixanthobacter aquaemixtae]MXO89844.1 cytochrome c maturation protein CcmE [Pontixanthobacter aquaemixtae]